MGKADFRFAIFRGDVENDVRAVHSLLSSMKFKWLSKTMPDDLLVGNDFRLIFSLQEWASLWRYVNSLTELAGVAFDLF